MNDVSPHNPFRTPAISPNPTGTAHEPPPTQIYAPPSTPRPDPTGLTEEAPPAYTQRPDLYQGESTLEYGPSRPFQQAPPPINQHPPQGPQWAPPQQGPGWPPQQQQQQPSLWDQLTGSMNTHNQPPQSGWSAYPGRQQHAPPPPPQLHIQPPPPPPPPTTNVSDFARDFYSTTSIPPGGISEVSPSPSAGGGYPPPPGRYQPPPGAPPPVSSPSNSVPDDGRPTATPVPGHPLLRDGNMLVYPPYHECSKCAKYARPYMGALTIAATPSASASSSSSSIFQRPLPAAAPHSSPHPPGSGYAPPSTPPPGAGSGYAPPPVPPPGGTFSPPGAFPAPGDPRIGGMLCWRCDGRGSISFLVFETTRCTVCGGVGRVFG
ncbi:hypothetical protein C8J57DRAFT_1322246 [Mycena rebaudengoi]|nr:hypothetical protein C8J57DRAFT_1322246 [Mycena rebaudengoi]